MRYTFRNYEIVKHNPFERFPPEKYIAAEADEAGEYTVHVRYKNGLGQSIVEKLTLFEAATLAFRFQDGLGLPQDSVWIDLPDHVINEPSILNRRIKDNLKKKGLYWKNTKRK